MKRKYTGYECKMQDAGCKMQDAGYRMPDAKTVWV